MNKNILVPLDGSKNSLTALTEAIKIAEKFTAKITIISIVNDTNVYPTYGGLHLPGDFIDSQRKQAREITDQGVKKAQLAGVSATGDVLNGNPRNIIATTYPEKKGIDLTVIGKSGVDAINRFFIGSTTAYVVRHSKANVLVVNEDENE